MCRFLRVFIVLLGNGKIAKKQQQYPKGGGYSQKSYGRGNGNYRREKNFSKDSKKLIGQNSNDNVSVISTYHFQCCNFQYFCCFSCIYLDSNSH